MTSTDNEPKSAARGATAGDAGASQKRPPTWDEIVRTQSPAGGRPEDGDTQSATLCFTSKDTVSASNFASENKPVEGKSVCVEKMSRRMARLIHEQRRAGGDIGWSEAWYGRWTQRWQVVHVLGCDNISKFLTGPRMTQLRVPKLFTEAEQRRFVRIVPMDRALVEGRDRFARHLAAITAPGLRMTRKYLDGWRSGECQERLAQIADNMRNLGAARIVGRMVAFFGRIKENVGKDN
ncbi:hypothetical protein IWQ56_001333 [Coemansia nantahalensis]|nr:hypothetical protein IWQ56_001333 [Coemansia nantahalensis]